MATWPVTLPDCSIGVGYSGSKEREILRTPFRAGYVATRPIHNRARSIFRSVGWSALEESLFTTFMDFFDTTSASGDTFTWYDNSKDTPVAYTVRFLSNSISWSLVNPNMYRVTFDLEEV